MLGPGGGPDGAVQSQIAAALTGWRRPAACGCPGRSLRNIRCASRGPNQRSCSSTEMSVVAAAAVSQALIASSETSGSIRGELALQLVTLLLDWTDGDWYPVLRGLYQHRLRLLELVQSLEGRRFALPLLQVAEHLLAHVSAAPPPQCSVVQNGSVAPRSLGSMGETCRGRAKYLCDSE